MKKYFESPDTLIGSLKQSKYILNENLAVAVYLSLVRKKPLFLEGEAGVGKTEIAKILSQVLNKNLIRLQCYEGLDINQAAYEWNYGQQIIALQSGNKEESDLFSKKYLIERPLLKAIQGSGGADNILLIDELDSIPSRDIVRLAAYYPRIRNDCCRNTANRNYYFKQNKRNS